MRLILKTLATGLVIRSLKFFPNEKGDTQNERTISKQRRTTI